MSNLRLSPVNWQKIRTRTLTARQFPGTPNRFQPIEPFLFTVDKPLCVVLMSSSTARSNWWSAGFVKAYLYSGAFVSRQIIGVKSWQLGLDRAELIDFRGYKTSNKRYALEINTRPWHKQMKIQVWKYRGNVNDAVDEYQQIMGQQIADVAELVKNLTDYSL